MVMPKFTPTQQRFMQLMSDGQRHRLVEFIELLPDQLGDGTNVHKHIQSLRDYLRLVGEDICCERINRAKTYRRVRTIGPGE